MQCEDAHFAHSLFLYHIIEVENYCGSHYVYLVFNYILFSSFFCACVSMGLLDLVHLEKNLAVVSIK